MKQQINITLEEETIKKIDLDRGLISRSVFINDILTKNLFKNKLSDENDLGDDDE